MKNFIVYNIKGKILRTGNCQNSTLHSQVKENKFVMEGTANDITQKIEFDGLDVDGQPINPRVVDKTPEEIETDNPKIKPKPFEKQIAYITNEQYQALLDRLETLETGKC